MDEKRTVPRRCSEHGTSRESFGHRREDIVADYERGTAAAAWLFVGMFAFLLLGVVMFGW